jgi:hypothetical protein
MTGGGITFFTFGAIFRVLAGTLVRRITFGKSPGVMATAGVEVETGAKLFAAGVEETVDEIAARPGELEETDIGFGRGVGVGIVAVATAGCGTTGKTTGRKTIPFTAVKVTTIPVATAWPILCRKPNIP